MRIEVGYALEEYVTDGFSGETSRDVMVPYFKQGDYGGGLLAGAQAVAARLAEKRGVKIPGVAAPASGGRRGAGHSGPYQRPARAPHRRRRRILSDHEPR